MKYVLCLHVLCTVCTLISICVFKISPLVEYILECNFTNFRHTLSLTRTVEIKCFIIGKKEIQV